MLVLGLDCAGSACSVALIDGDRTLAARQEVMQRGQAERIVPMIQDVLTEAGQSAASIDAVAVTVGPGAFTGVRIGIAAAQGIGRAAACPVVGVSVTEALAEAMPVTPEGRLIVVIDSRRADPFCEAFTAVDGRWLGDGARAGTGGLSGLGPLFGLDRCSETGSGTAFVGDLASSAAIEFPGAAVPPVSPYPDPALVAALGCRAVEAGQARPPVPLYLRAPDVSAPSKDRARRPAGR